MNCTNFLLFLGFIVFTTKGQDLVLKDVKLEYTDNQTNAKQSVRRELKRFGDDSYWSKPDSVDIVITIANKGNVPIKFRFFPEMYFLLSQSDSQFVSIKSNYKEISDITKEPLWAWNRSLFRPVPAEIGPDTSLTITLGNQSISSDYSPFQYQIEALGIKVIVSPIGKSDPNLTNNVFTAVVQYGD